MEIIEQLEHRTGLDLLRADDGIPQGQRNTSLCKLAGGMRRSGLDQPAILTALLSHNQVHCKPPLGDDEVRKIAGSIGRYPAPASPKPCQPGDELDIQQIVRPELFLTPAVAGVTLPVSMLDEGKACGRWMTYLQWADGRREAVDLFGILPLPGGSRLIVNPIPAPPGPTHQPAWSAVHRKAWLAGAPAADGGDIFHRLCKIIADYIDFPADKAQGSIALLALYTMLSYCYPAWPAVPYLYLGGPAGSGKTRVFELLEQLIFRPIRSSNLTAPAMFRTLHERGGVLLLDEAERLRERTPDVGELLSILLAGYKRGGLAQRLKPETFELQEFDVFGPKAIACIAGLPGPLLSRCIPLSMFRCPPDSQKSKRRLTDDAERWQGLRDDLHAWALGSAADLLVLPGLDGVCEDMTGRHYELWQPLLAIAALLHSENIHAPLYRFALATIADNQEDATPDTDETILLTLSKLIVQGRSPSVKEIHSLARIEAPELFARYSPKGVANILAKYGLKTAKSNGLRTYRTTVGELRHIQKTYAVDLNLPGEGTYRVDGVTLQGR